MKNLQLTKFNLRFGYKQEAELFIQKYKELNLPISILGQSFLLNNKKYIFIGLSEIKSNSILLLNKLTNSNYNNILIQYNAILLDENELYTPNNYFFRFKKIIKSKSESKLILNLKEFTTTFSSLF